DATGPKTCLTSNTDAHPARRMVRATLSRKGRRKEVRGKTGSTWNRLALVGLCKFSQRGPEDLTGLADERRAAHFACGVGKCAGDADAHREVPAEQGACVGAGGMALNDNFALEGISLHRVVAGIK